MKIERTNARIITNIQTEIIPEEESQCDFTQVKEECNADG